MNKCLECGKPIKDNIILCSDCLEKEFTKTDTEEVNHPTRYGGDTTYECIKVLKNWCSEEEYRGFLKCNAIKYLCRAGKKDEIVQELKKTVWYVNKLIESYEEEND